MDITTQGQGYKAYHFGGEGSQKETAGCRAIDVLMEVHRFSFAALLTLMPHVYMADDTQKCRHTHGGYEYMTHLHSLFTTCANDSVDSPVVISSRFYHWLFTAFLLIFPALHPFRHLCSGFLVSYIHGRNHLDPVARHGKARQFKE